MDWLKFKEGRNWPTGFEKQQNKWGYLNNPRWQAVSKDPVSFDGREGEEPQVWSPPSEERYSCGDSVKHNPCGHWHKGYKPPTLVPEIYGLTCSRTIWGVRFHKEKLSFIGYYIDDSLRLQGLIPYKGNLLTVSGSLSTAGLRWVTSTVNRPYSGEGRDGTGQFTLIKTTRPFNEYDVPSEMGGDHTLAIDKSGRVVYVSKNGYIVELESPYVRATRGYAGTVVKGTDKNLYYYDMLYPGFMWSEWGRPITGWAWDALWNRTPDNLNDGPRADWGQKERFSASGIGMDQNLTSRYYYVLMHEVFGRVYCLKRRTYELVGKGSVGPQVGAGLYVDDGGAVYGGSGHFGGSWVSKLRSKTLELLEQTTVLGRFGHMTKQCGHLIVATNNYGTSDAGIYKLSLDDLSVKGKIILSAYDPLAGADCIVPLQEPYVAIAGWDRISVYDVDDMRLVDTITTPKELNISWGHRGLTVIYRPLSDIQEN